MLEELFKERENECSILIEQIKDGVNIVQDGVFKFVNRPGAEITGYTVNELIGKPFWSIVPDDIKELIAQKYKSFQAGEEFSSHYETKIHCKDGTIKDIEAYLCVIKYNMRPAVMAIICDITKRKKREEELLKVQKLESLGVLAGGIGHDFNNLLAAILGNLSLGKLYTKSEANVLEVLTEAEKATKQAQELIQQLLTFARSKEPIKKIVHIPELIKDIAHLSLSGSKVRCEFSLPTDLWWTEIDKEQIIQAINNLIINADQAMPDGGIIKINAENVMIGPKDKVPLKEGKYVKILVADQGIGIPEKYLFKLFDPYFTTKQKGSGLGLTITYFIIKNHGGYITVESVIGAGTTFYIYLPAVEKGNFTIEEGK